MHSNTKGRNHAQRCPQSSWQNFSSQHHPAAPSRSRLCSWPAAKTKTAIPIPFANNFWLQNHTRLPANPPHPPGPMSAAWTRLPLSTAALIDRGELLTILLKGRGLLTLQQLILCEVAQRRPAATGHQRHRGGHPDREYDLTLRADRVRWQGSGQTDTGGPGG